MNQNDVELSTADGGRSWLYLMGTLSNVILCKKGFLGKRNIFTC